MGDTARQSVIPSNRGAGPKNEVGTVRWRGNPRRKPSPVTSPEGNPSDEANHPALGRRRRPRGVGLLHHRGDTQPGSGYRRPVHGRRDGRHRRRRHRGRLVQDPARRPPRPRASSTPSRARARSPSSPPPTRRSPPCPRARSTGCSRTPRPSSRSSSTTSSGQGHGRPGRRPHLRRLGRGPRDQDRRQGRQGHAERQRDRRHHGRRDGNGVIHVIDQVILPPAS